MPQVAASVAVRRMAPDTKGMWAKVMPVSWGDLLWYRGPLWGPLGHNHLDQTLLLLEESAAVQARERLGHSRLRPAADQDLHGVPMDLESQHVRS